MKDYSDYRPPSSQTLLWSAKKLFKRKLEDFGEHVIVDGVETKAIIMTHSNPYNQNKEDRKFLCEEEVLLKRGSLVEYDSGKWLVISDVKCNKVNKYAQIFKCNNLFKLYKNNIIYEIPCIIESSVGLSRMGVEENKDISQIKGNRIGLISKNDITMSIRAGNIIKIGRWNYEVLFPDDIIMPGLIVLDLRIVIEEAPQPNYSIVILNGDNITIPLEELFTLNAKLYDGDIEVENPPLIFESSNEEIATVDEKGVITPISEGNVIITVKLATDETIYSEINLIVQEVVEDEYAANVYGDSIAYLDFNITIYADVYKNGVLDEESGVKWVVTNQDGTLNEYLSIVEQNSRSIILKVASNPNFKGKMVDIKGIYTEDDTVFDIHTVKLSSLF